MEIKGGLRAGITSYIAATTKISAHADASKSGSAASGSAIDRSHRRNPSGHFIQENKVKTVLALLLAALCSTSAVACDKVTAQRVQLMLYEMGAEWSEKDGRVALNWGWEWDGAGPNQRLRLLQAFAAGDTCLTGQAREINFYRKGKLVGRASPTSGIRLVN